MPTKPLELHGFLPDSADGKRFDQALSQLFPMYSRSQWQTWIREGHVALNNTPHTKLNTKIASGDEIHLKTVLTEQKTWAPEAISLDIVYEDDELLVVNKPADLVVHPAAGNYEGTLSNALLYHCPDLAQLPRAGLIHRLDKGTSGLLVVAKTLSAHHYLVQQLQAREFAREYIAVVHGTLIAGDTIEAPIGRHPQHRTKMAITPGGREAITHYRVSARYPHHTLLRVQLETGRTHQIRVHLASIHHPIVGDHTYGKRLIIPKHATPELVHLLRTLKRQALHATHLGLTHPTTQEWMEWEVPPPADMLQLIQCLEEQTP